MCTITVFCTRRLYDAYGRSSVFDGACLFNLSNAVPLMACVKWRLFDGVCPITIVQRGVYDNGLHDVVCTMAFDQRHGLDGMYLMA